MTKSKALETLARELAAHPHGKVPRDLRRRQVLAEAHDLFVERGYHGASMDELARRVGVSKPVVYALAGSKERLFQDVMQAVGEDLALRVGAAVAAEPELANKLRAGILAFLRFVAERREAWDSLLASDAGPGTRELAAMRFGQARRVADAVPAAGAAADPRVREALAHAIDGACELAALWWQRHPEVRAEALADLLAELFLPGVVSLLTREGPSILA